MRFLILINIIFPLALFGQAPKVKFRLIEIKNDTLYWATTLRNPSQHPFELYLHRPYKEGIENQGFKLTARRFIRLSKRKGVASPASGLVLSGGLARNGRTAHFACSEVLGRPTYLMQYVEANRIEHKNLSSKQLADLYWKAILDSSRLITIPPSGSYTIHSKVSRNLLRCKVTASKQDYPLRYILGANMRSYVSSCFACMDSTNPKRANKNIFIVSAPVRIRKSWLRAD